MALVDRLPISSGATPGRGDWRYWTAWTALAKWGGFALIGLIYFPLFWLALMSISDKPLSGIPYPFSLENYVALFQDRAWVEPFMASIVVGLIVAVVCAVVATVVGRAIPLLRRPGRVVLVALLPLFVPGMSMGAALFILLRSFLGFKLGFWSILIGHIVWALPFSLLIVLVLTTRFDHRLVEAAADLGASKWRIFWDIEFPILRPAIIGAGLFGFLISFNEMLRSIFLRGTETTMPIWNWIMASSQQSQVPIIFSLATIVLAVVLPLLAGVFWLVFARMDRS
ncbi:MAG: ABC transporter permease subunit [Bauldia sp.]|nr:ABC transporter permease subunit [Bauldia sp.]